MFELRLLIYEKEINLNVHIDEFCQYV